MGINLGAFIAPLVTGYLGEKINWHLGFAVAAVGMTFGVIQYVVGRRKLGDAGERPADPLLGADRRRALTRVGLAAAPSSCSSPPSRWPGCSPSTRW
ncbi:hypothetical protein GCM10027614_08220 [Micromonospora vulcania]